MYKPSDHTFVICAYGDNPFLENTVDSLERQTVRGNIILATHTPSNYIEDICNRHGIDITINPAPHLAGDDWNWGYDQADTPLVTIAHQDDIYYEPYLEAFLDVLNNYASQGVDDVSIVHSDYDEIRGDMLCTDNTLLRVKRIMNAPMRSSMLNGSRFIKRRILSFGSPICCPSVMFVKPNAGPSVFDTTYVNSCDYKTFVELASRKGRMVYIPESLMAHRIYEESATSRNLSENIRRKEDQQILSTLWPKPIASLINAVYSKSEKSNEL